MKKYLADFENLLDSKLETVRVKNPIIGAVVNDLHIYATPEILPKEQYLAISIYFEDWIELEIIKQLKSTNTPEVNFE